MHARLAVLVLGHEAAQQREIVDENLLGLHALRNFLEDVQCAAGPCVVRQMGRDAGLFPACLLYTSPSPRDRG